MSKAYDIIVLTESRYVNPTTIDWYVNQVLTEDQLLLDAFSKLGLKSCRKDWNENFDWTTTKAVIFRTTWDYFHKIKDFKKWLEKVKSQTILINPYDLIRWNLDKNYLKDLENNGVAVVDTYFIKKGDKRTLHQIHETLNWDKTVIKPVFSGAGRHTYKLNKSNLSQHEKIYQTLIKEEDLMLQPFQENVVLKGEISLMVFGGKCSHAVLKKAKKGDFRVQDDFGGTVEVYQPDKQEIEFAEYAVNKCNPKPDYARVDVIYDNNNQLCISELELIEPELWFRNKPESADVLAKNIYNKYFK
jgi:glutathione synthase/RimK-type ligase-like ATP-grasp enzyme